jgi:hypothetical protein
VLEYKLTMGNILEQADAYLASLLYDWSFTTTLIALALAAFIAYPIFSPSEPDTHPLLLARQSAINPVRNKNESAIYRSPEVPGDTPLKSGLGVKDASAPRWAMGKDGDVRDVWREVMKGGKEDDVPKGRILTVFGREEVLEHEVEKMTGEIAVIGKHLKDAGVQRVAIYLPNCVEYLMAVFGMCILCRLENATRETYISEQHAHSMASHQSFSQTTSRTLRYTSCFRPPLQMLSSLEPAIFLWTKWLSNAQRSTT